jgi:hypothetical protein
VFADSLTATLDINGVAVEPDATNVQRLTICNTSFINRTHSAHFWADLDALEAVPPGSFIDQPLVITAYGATGTGTGAGTVAIRSRGYLTVIDSELRPMAAGASSRSQ